MSQFVSKYIELEKKSGGGFWKILVWGMFLLDTLVKKMKFFCYYWICNFGQKP